MSERSATSVQARLENASTQLGHALEEADDEMMDPIIDAIAATDAALAKETGESPDQLRADGGVQDSGGEQACRRQAKIAADRTWRNFEELGERLEELALVHDDEDALQAWQKVEDTVTALDDAIGTAQEAIDDER